MTNKSINSTPFSELKIAYFKFMDMPGEKNYLDCTDEQILNNLCKIYGENLYIVKIEKVEVLEVISYVPAKRKLDVSELKIGRSIEERLKIEKKIEDLKTKFEEKL